MAVGAFGMAGGPQPGARQPLRRIMPTALADRMAVELLEFALDVGEGRSIQQPSLFDHSIPLRVRPVALVAKILPRSRQHRLSRHAMADMA